MEFKDKDQFFYAQWIWNDIQNPLFGKGLMSNLGVEVGTETCGVKRDMSWKVTEFRTWDSICNEICNRDNGFEWRINYEWTGKRVRRWLDIYHTRMSVGQYPFEFYKSEFGGNILDYEFERDSVSAATSFTAKGATPDGKDEALYSTIYESEDFRANGYFHFDALLDRTGVGDVAKLNEYASFYAATRGGTKVHMELTVPFEQIDRTVLGSSVRIQITDNMHPSYGGMAGLNLILRCIGYEVNGGGVVKLILDDSNVFASYRKTFTDVFKELKDKLVRK